jgi:hypothetical protein
MRFSVVFQDQELAGGVADQVGAHDVKVLTARRVEANHLGPVTSRIQHHLFRDHAFAEDAAGVIDVVQEQVEGPDALHQAGFHHRPLRGRHRPRDQVEGEDLFHPAAVGIHREGDALVHEHQVRAGAPLLKLGRQQPPEPVQDQPAMGVRQARRREYFVPGLRVRAIPRKQRGGRLRVSSRVLRAAEGLTLKHHWPIIAYFPCDDSVAWTRRSTCVEGGSGRMQS